MRLSKRFGLGTVLTALTIAVVGGLIGSRQVHAITGSWFSEKNIAAVSGGSSFYFTDSGGKTIDVSIKDQNGNAKTVSFGINGNQTPQKDKQFEYINSTDFCRPADGSFPAASTNGGGYSKDSIIAVLITGVNPVTGKIVQNYSNGFGVSNVGIWPGPNQTNCGQAVGTGANQQHYPIAVKQDSVSNKTPSKATGKGSNFTKDTVSNANFVFSGGAGVIKMSLPGSSGTDATFVDRQPYDKDFNYVSTAPVFCDRNGGLTKGQLNLTPPPSSTFDSIAIKASTKFNYFNGDKCVSDAMNVSINNPQDNLTDGSTTTLAEEFAQWDTDSKGNAVIDIMKCNTSDASCSADFQLSLVQNAGGTTYVQDTSNKCGGYNLELNSAKGYTGNFYQNNGSSGTCGRSNNRIVGITGTYDQAAKPPDPSGGAGSTQTCEDNPWTLSWLACPVLNGIDSLMNDLNGFIESQLTFQVGDNLTPEVHQLWMAIRDISSIFLILIMLVMVIAQALGGLGGLDAYTVRKVLPKIIIAVIFAQVSWPLLSWIISVANDAGHGIADIMFFPFNGAAQMSLPALLHRIGWAAPATTTDIALFSGFLVLVLNPFGVLIFALAVVMALLTAFATLMFRTMLIIGCVVFFPLFMMAWILPGTKKYWDMWRSNFSKALMMFPLIMAMIAVGRIFAWISGGSGNSGVGNGAAFKDIAVLIGYFGPYFFIPKAFTWGGSLLTQANNAISGVSKKIGEGPKKILQERQKELAHQRQISAAMRLNQWERGRLNAGQKFMSAIRGDKLRSGEWDPTYRLPFNALGKEEMKRQRREKMAKFRAAVPRAEQEEVNDEFDRLKQRVADMSESARGELVRGIIAHPHDHSEAEVQAALKQALSDRDYATVEAWINANVSTAHGREQINLFRNLNAGDLSSSVPHLLKGDIDENGLHQGIVRAAGSSQQEVAGFHARAVESIISHLTYYAQHGTDAAKRDTARRELDGFLRTYAAATQNPDVQGSVNRGAAEVVRRFMESGTIIGDYGARAETNHAFGGAAPIQLGPDNAEKIRIMTDPSMSETVQTIQGKISGGGVIAPGTASISSPVQSPAEIQIQHTSNYTVNLPPTAAIAAPAAGAPPNPQREAFKASVISDESTAQTLAHALAYDVDPGGRATHVTALQELRASSVGNSDRTAAFNSVITRVQQAYAQRIRDEAAHARANPPAGMTPDQAAAAATQAAQAALAPQMQAFESMRII